MLPLLPSALPPVWSRTIVTVSRSDSERVDVNSFGRRPTRDGFGLSWKRSGRATPGGQQEENQYDGRCRRGSPGPRPTSCPPGQAIPGRGIAFPDSRSTLALPTSSASKRRQRAVGITNVSAAGRSLVCGTTGAVPAYPRLARGIGQHGVDLPWSTVGVFDPDLVLDREATRRPHLLRWLEP